MVGSKAGLATWRSVSMRTTAGDTRRAASATKLWVDLAPAWDKPGAEVVGLRARTGAVLHGDSITRAASKTVNPGRTSWR